jgi:hypothetical protein
MPWHDVQFRLLQVMLRPIGDERRTVALLHWDGVSLRLALVTRQELKSFGPLAEEVWPSLQTLVAALRPVLEGDASQRALGLDALHKVPEGLGSLLLWGPLRVGRTSDPQAHFQELVAALGLTPHGEAQPARKKFGQRSKRIKRRLLRRDTSSAALPRRPVAHPGQGTSKRSMS